MGFIAISILTACGGGETDSAPSTAAVAAAVAVAVQPAAPAVIDAGQHISLTAAVTGDTTAMGVQWSVACPAAVASCGGMQAMTSGSGVPDQFEANGAVGAAEVVKVTATSLADRTKSMTVSIAINPSPVAAQGIAPQSATTGTAYSLELATFLHGGTPPFTCTLSSGSLPAGLSLDVSTATVTGTAATASGPLAAAYICNDSASPPVSLPSALDVSIQVSPPPPPVDSGEVLQMHTARYGHTATLLPNGSVLIAGGAHLNDGGPTVYLTAAELYNPSKESLAQTGSLRFARFAHTASLLSSGKVLLAGGAGSPTAELYDPSSGQFTSASAMMTVRSGHSATTLPDGRVLIAGGRGANNEALASAELYDPVAAHFSSVGSMSTARAEHAAALLGDGRVLITGGADGKMALASAEIFDPKSNSFSVTGSMSVPRRLHTATSLDLGTVLVAGGMDLLDPAQFAHPLASAELYDPKSGSFVPTGGMVTARASHTASLRKDGSVVLVGGGDGVAGNPFCDGHLVGNCWPAVVLLPTTSVEVYDPQTNGFLPSPTLALARELHTTTVLADGTLLVAGGQVLHETIYQAGLVDTLPATQSVQILIQTTPVPTPVIEGFSSVLTPCAIRFLCGGPSITITADISYSVPLTMVQVFVEGKLIRTLSQPPYQMGCAPNAARLPIFTVTATDENGNVATRSVSCH
jgi:hypothetical protein